MNIRSWRIIAAVLVLLCMGIGLGVEGIGYLSWLDGKRGVSRVTVWKNQLLSKLRRGRKEIQAKKSWYQVSWGTSLIQLEVCKTRRRRGNAVPCCGTVVLWYCGTYLSTFQY